MPSHTAELTTAFRFPFESNLQDNVATMARKYVHSVISSVQRVAVAICSSGLSLTLGPKLSPGPPEVITLAHCICQSYHLGAGLLISYSVDGDLSVENSLAAFRCYNVLLN